MATYHRNAFSYAVPRHCLEHGHQYNPYDLLTVSHEVVFGSKFLENRQLPDARFDYYTVSAMGFTFHSQQDNFAPTFLTTEEWERQKRQFDKITSLTTFQLFRYRKVFLAWKGWVRYGKMANAKAELLSRLYFSHPLLFEAMRETRRELEKLENIVLLSDFGGETYHLSHYATQNVSHVNTARCIARLKQTVPCLLKV
ncbi:hypothetical protein PINS_up005599 [Pythium insidiosum]|nr:hypothetical protein PINS_up005599 [Pythium insidiosum]